VESTKGWFYFRRIDDHSSKYDCDDRNYLPIELQVFDRTINSYRTFFKQYIIIGIIIMVSLQIAYTYLPEMNLLFKSAPISLEAWMMIIVISIISFLIIEIEKWIGRKRNSYPKPYSKS
jgi:hypothetical protein